MKIISYNLNGIRAALNKDLIGFLKIQNPDIVCFQETKAQPEQIDEALFEALGYRCYWHSAIKKGYSGVGILSKLEPTHVEIGCGMEKYDAEGRVLRADFAKFSVYSIYFPSGTTGDERQDFKMMFLSDIEKHLLEVKQTHPNLVVTGDFNICHTPIDIHDPVRNKDVSGFKPEEREWVSHFLELGFIDSFRHLHSEPHNYTWWSYRARAREKNLGWRIDYQMVTDTLKSNIQAAEILAHAVHSDHCPTSLKLQL